MTVSLPYKNIQVYRALTNTTKHFLHVKTESITSLLFLVNSTTWKERSSLKPHKTIFSFIPAWIAVVLTSLLMKQNSLNHPSIYNLNLSNNRTVKPRRSVFRKATDASKHSLLAIGSSLPPIFSSSRDQVEKVKGGLSFKRHDARDGGTRGGDAGDESDMFAVRIWQAETAGVWAAEWAKPVRAWAACLSVCSFGGR